MFEAHAHVQVVPRSGSPILHISTEKRFTLVDQTVKLKCGKNVYSRLLGIVMTGNIVLPARYFRADARRQGVDWIHRKPLHIKARAPVVDLQHPWFESP